MPKEEQDRLVKELESDIDRLQALYNQYFMGIEKLEPTIHRKKVERKIAALRKMHLTNSIVRFRFQGQVQRYNTQTTYWRRVCRQIEEGTYTRHVMLAKKRVAKRHGVEEGDQQTQQEHFPGADSVDDEIPIHIIELDDFGNGFSADEIPTDTNARPEPQHLNLPVQTLEAVDDPFDDNLKIASKEGAVSHPATKAPNRLPIKNRLPLPIVADSKPARPIVPMAQKKSLPVKGELDPNRTKTIYRTYLAARKKCKESTTVPFEKVAKSLAKKYEATNGEVDFKVVIRKGKAVIKTVPK
jgi:hypothetical protein